MWKYLNKGISTPLAIIIILILAAMVGGYTLWQYAEIQKEQNTQLLEIKISDKKVILEEKFTQEQGCLNSGGIVSMSSCCKLSGDFPNSCLIGACGCSPTDSHQVKTCDCGESKCFDGNSCVSVGEKEESYLHLTSPKGGEKICIGDDFIIQWESKGLETVGISLKKERSGGYNIDAVLATRNETGGKNDEGKGVYVWKAGHFGTVGTVNEGEVYQIQILGGGFIEESGYFSLVNCEG
jgi:hypothetical protein